MRTISYFGAGLVLCGLVFIGGCGCPDASTVDIDEPVVLDVTSSDGAIKGVVGVSPNKKRVKALYMIRASVDLPETDGCAIEPCVRSDNKSYDYIASLPRRDEEHPGDGSFSAIRCNKDIILSDPFAEEPDFYGCSPDDTEDTNEFYWTIEGSFPSLAAVKQATTLNIHDGSDYWVVTDETTYPDGSTSYSSSIDDDAAAAETAPVKTFTLQYSER